MQSNQEVRSMKPSAVTFVQILFYLAALLNIVNGIFSFGSPGIVKKTLCIAMILFGIAAVFVAYRLNLPRGSRRQAAIVLSCILIVLRIIEFAVWGSIGFLLGVILPVIVIWRLYSSEAKAWFR